MPGQRPKLNPKIKSIDDLLRISDEIQNQPPKQEHSEEAGSNPIIITVLPIEKIRMFQKHPFHLYEGERLDDMVESVKANGVLIPAIVRKVGPDEKGCEYEMLSGHNRMNAASIAGLYEIPCIVKESISDEEAWIYVVETNVLQRSFADMLPSEKAAVLALRYSKMFSQGKRNDIIAELKMLEDPQYNKKTSTSTLIGTKLRTDEKLGAEYGLSKNTIARLLRIDKLVPELKRRVDKAEIGIYPAVDISFLSEMEQQAIESVLLKNEYKLDMKKSKLLRAYSGRLNQELTCQILSGEKNRRPKSSMHPPIKIKYKTYSQYFPADTKPSEMECVIEKALREYFVHHPKTDGTEEQGNMAIS